MHSVARPQASFNGVSRGSSATTTRLSIEQLAQLSGVESAELSELMEFGVLTEVRPEPASTTFEIGLVMTLQRAQRLRQDLALDDHAFALAVMLLREVSDLEEEVRLVRSEAQRYLAEIPSRPVPGPLSSKHSER